MSEVDVINKISSNIYKELDQILRKISRRYYFRLFLIHKDGKQKFKRAARIIKTISEKQGQIYEADPEIMQEEEDVFSELKIVVNGYKKWRNFASKLKDYINTYDLDAREIENEMVSDLVEGQEEQLVGPERRDGHEVKILYSNFLELSFAESKETISYILEIKDLDRNTKDLFYEKSSLSFLRMIFDYFFHDYFSINAVGELEKKYNEDSTQFRRRISRLFFGKIQSFLRTGGVDNTISNEYYVSSLMEKLDDISTSTYEGSSPFGSILFLNQQTLKAENSIVKYTIKFKKDDRILLEDSKRIRKLLELTNREKDLYLIADHQSIYGLGEIIGWNHMGKNTVLRLDFKGLSKYRLVLISIEEGTEVEGRIVVEAGQKIYQADRKIMILDKNLISVNFKNPSLSEEGYTTEKFKRIVRTEFYGSKVTLEQDKKIEKLEKVVSKARDQKHGTIVVITEDRTAKDELEILEKQSTLIEPMEIDPEYVQFLTAIDGAIYFDLNGVCHAIGVILDGVAKREIGDSSRGARYNSAYRYWEKLKDKETPQKCVIAIISEDGMVDIIPELDNEEKILILVRELVDVIKQEKNERNDKVIEEKETKLLKYENIDFQHYFRIADEFRNNKQYTKALSYYELGFKKAGDLNISSMHHNRMGLCYFNLGGNENLLSAVSKFNDAIQKCGDYMLGKLTFYSNLGHAYFDIYIELLDNSDKEELIKQLKLLIAATTEAIDIGKEHDLTDQSVYISSLNRRGIGYACLSRLEESEELKSDYQQKSLHDYTSYLEFKESKVVYKNRATINLEIGLLDGYIKDIVSAECLVSEQSNLRIIKEKLDEHPNLVIVALDHYDSIKTEKQSSEELEALLKTYDAQMSDRNSEVATTKEPKKD